MLRKLVNISLIALMFCMSEVIAYAGTTGSEELKKSNTSETASECFEGVSRAMFKLNHGLDKVIFKPVAKGYRKLPSPVQTGIGNFLSNLRFSISSGGNASSIQYKS